MLLTFCVKVFSRCMFLKLYICDFYREHQKMLQRKLMVRVVTEWRGVADRCMQRAVHDFAVRIGLQSPEDFSGEALSTSGDSGKLDSISMYFEDWYFYTWLHNNDRIWEDFDISTESADRLQLLTDMILASENTSGIHSPVASSTLGTPMKRYQISDLMYVYLQER